jgi:hypothetical protein
LEPWSSCFHPQRLSQAEWQRQYDVARSRTKRGKLAMIIGGAVAAAAVPLYQFSERACVNATFGSGPIDCRSQDPEALRLHHNQNVMYLAINLGLGGACLVVGGRQYSGGRADLRVLDAQTPDAFGRFNRHQ